MSIEIRRAHCLTFLESLESESVDLITTDPAYSGMNEHLALGHGRIVGDRSEEDWFAEFSDTPENWAALLAQLHRVLKPGGALYLMFDSYTLLTVGPMVRNVFDVKGIIVWDKTSIGMGHYFRRQHELILFATKGKHKLNGRGFPDVWSIKRPFRPAYKTQKPVELFERMLEASAKPGHVVCDPFVGSGSSAIAAHKQQCSFVGSDVSENAVGLARHRVEHYSHTGIDLLEAKK